MTISTTHDVTITGDRVRKRFVTAERDEADREWLGLTTMAALLPGLAPQPVGREIDDGVPAIVMTRLPGRPLGPDPLDDRQREGVVAAYRLMFGAPVPAEIPERRAAPTELSEALREWAVADYDLTGCRDHRLVGEALAAARSAVTERLPEPVDPVISLGDGNLANLLWDGECCRLMDFEDFGRSELTYEIADLVEHAASRLNRTLPADPVIAAFALTDAQAGRLAAYRRLFARFWLIMLVPGNPGFARNPAGSVEDQARHLLDLLDGAAPAG